MSPAAEMFKYMAIGFAGIGLVALAAILIGRGMQWVASKAVPTPETCPCGKRKECMYAAYLGLCNVDGRTRFISRGKIVPKPTRGWIAYWITTGVVAALWVLEIRGDWNPVVYVYLSPIFLFVLGSLIWTCVVQVVRRPRR